MEPPFSKTVVCSYVDRVLHAQERTVLRHFGIPHFRFLDPPMAWFPFELLDNECCTPSGGCFVGLGNWTRVDQ